MPGVVLIIGTCDTKADELGFAAECLSRAGTLAEIIDVSTSAAASHAARRLRGTTRWACLLSLRPAIAALP